MSHSATNPFERADVLKLFEPAPPGTSASPAEDSGSNDDAPITDLQYSALLCMMAAKLGISRAEAERIFPFHKHEQADAGLTDTSIPTIPSQLPPLCAHLSREGAMVYYGAKPQAHTIPDVRCCDAREIHKQEAFPAPCHGPHVHCLHCFQQSIKSAPSPGRGVAPPIVADYCDSASLQAHFEEHRTLYKAYLRVLEVEEEDACNRSSSSSSSDGKVDLGAEGEVLVNENLAACEAAAEEASRHVCFMASMGTVACPLVVFYCAECDYFAPLVSFHRVSVATSTSSATGADTWVAMEGANVVLSRLLLSCHVLYMFDAQRFSHQGRSTRHLLYLFKPVLFSVETEESLIEEFESDAECTYTAVVLPDASVAGDPPQLLLREDAEGEAPDVTQVLSCFSPVVIGFAMEWRSAELLQKKVAMVLEHHRRAAAACSQDGGEPSSSSPTSPAFHVTTRRVYVVDTGKWEVAHVLYHRLLAAHAELPQNYLDKADYGIRVQDTYKVDVPMPAWTDVAMSEDEPNAVDEWSGGGESDESVAAAASIDALDVDGCPYTMESRTIDFFTRMLVLAKAIHELSAWRLTIDENKEPSLL
ncbi:hypothetical protein JKF63_04659 [Porcisia hertigi]|uniref:Uncharacterized protein n=1 Tax=Porcisia hertigi TaxID=2761500 RepID=A0A836ITP0_9TRYP|nr:hypothetical protein JKF63_04659 [Porcisia hertigi]